MTPKQLKAELCSLTMSYAFQNQIPIDTTHKSAIVFADLEDSFCSGSYKAIVNNDCWRSRTEKAHGRVPGVKEMQSSNSSDALLMNIFCHPYLLRWQKVRDLLGVVPNDPVFGFNARVANNGLDPERTEIDMVIGDCFFEAKLTENDFKTKNAAVVENYGQFWNAFHVDCLARKNGSYRNYQVIRNLLAAIQHCKKHILLCDQRRPDLARAYMETVCCLNDCQMRIRCRVIYWQELCGTCGRDLRLFLRARYGF